MSRSEDLPVALALEVDALCDDFERHWRRSARRGEAPPDAAAFLSRARPEARPALRHWLRALERDLRLGVELPSVPGLALEEEIGRGGTGVVYRAREAGTGRPVALKLIPGDEHARWSSRLAELAGLRHPNLVPLEAFGTHAGLHYVVMPLARGGDLKEHMARYQDGSRAAALVAKVAGAVGFLHRRGILHRDIKPSNILLEDGEPLVCDFGLAGRAGEGAGAVVGTPAYMAPEQRAGRALTPAADVWGIGAVLRELVGEGDRRLVPVWQRCLEVEPSSRYPSAGELAEELRGMT